MCAGEWSQLARGRLQFLMMYTRSDGMWDRQDQSSVNDACTGMRAGDCSSGGLLLVALTALRYVRDKHVVGRAGLVHSNHWLTQEGGQNKSGSMWKPMQYASLKTEEGLKKQNLLNIS